MHDDVISWKHFPRYWPFVRGIHRSPVNSPHKGQWRGALIFNLICAWINGWVNSREAADLRRHHAHYDVIVMVWLNYSAVAEKWYLIWQLVAWRNPVDNARNTERNTKMTCHNLRPFPELQSWCPIDLFFFFIVHRKRIHRAHIRHNLIQATHCYVNTYHNGYTIHVLPNFLYIHIYIHTYIHTLMYRHLHVSTYTYTHIYIFKPEVFFFSQWKYCT